MHKTERLVIDVNVVISSILIVPSVAARVIDHAVANCRILVTDQTRRELIATLTSPKFDRYASQSDRQTVLGRLAPAIDQVQVLQLVRQCRDPHDDAALEAALNGRAHVIITGDKDLLALHPFRGIDIMTPAQFIERLERQSDDGHS